MQIVLGAFNKRVVLGCKLASLPWMCVPTATPHPRQRVEVALVVALGGSCFGCFK